MKGKKLLFLVLALLLPVAIFIFLKIFGRNEFQVGVFHEAGNIVAPHCSFEYTTPYRVPDSIMTNFQADPRDSLFVFYFGHSLNTAMNRISVEFAGKPVQIIDGEGMPGQAGPDLLRQCILLMKSDTSVALVDHKRRIRGYYDGNDRDEVDRLIVEIKIILKQF